MKEKLHTGVLYLPGDAEILAYQMQCLEKLYDYNATRPSEMEKRQKLLQEMFAELAKIAMLSRLFTRILAALMCISAKMFIAIFI